MFTTFFPMPILPMEKNKKDVPNNFRLFAAHPYYLNVAPLRWEPSFFFL